MCSFGPGTTANIAGVGFPPPAFPEVKVGYGDKGGWCQLLLRAPRGPLEVCWGWAAAPSGEREAAMAERRRKRTAHCLFLHMSLNERGTQEIHSFRLMPRGAVQCQSRIICSLKVLLLSFVIFVCSDFKVTIIPRAWLLLKINNLDYFPILSDHDFQLVICLNKTTIVKTIKYNLIIPVSTDCGSHLHHLKTAC